MIIDMILLVLFLGLALWSVLRYSLLRAAIALAFCSTALTALMFRLGAPLAAVFELSVCAGLITVVFVATISLTKPIRHQDIGQAEWKRLGRYGFLPVLVLLIMAELYAFGIPFDVILPPKVAEPGVREMLWNVRQFDMLGQVLVLMAGVAGIIVFFVNPEKDREDEP